MRNVFLLPLVLLFPSWLGADLWSPVDSPTAEALQKIVHVNGRFVTLTAPGAENPGVFHSVDGENWADASLPEHFSPEGLAAGEEAGLLFGSLGGTPSVLLSDDGISWSAPAGFPATESPIAGAAFSGGRFWVLPETGDLLHSADGAVWEPLARPGGLTSLGGGNGFLFRDSGGPAEVLAGTIRQDGSVSWAAGAVPTPVRAAASTGDRAVLLLTTTGWTGFAVSGDHQSWMMFPMEGNPALEGLSVAGNRFWATGDGKIFSSLDGARWVDRSEGAGGAGIRSIASGNGWLVAVGEGGAVLRRSAVLPPGIIRQMESEVAVKAGGPLRIGFEWEAVPGATITWRRDGAELAEFTGPHFTISEAGEEAAGIYQATVEAPGVEAVQMDPIEVTVESSGFTPVRWETAAVVDAPAFLPPGLSHLQAFHLVNMARNGNAFFATGRPDGAPFDLFVESGANGYIPAAWSAQGLFWSPVLTGGFPLNRLRFSGAAGGKFWMSGDAALISEDGIAWRRLETGLPFVRLVGWHDGRLFAVGGNRITWRQPDGTWVHLPQGLPGHLVGGYLSEGDRLLLAMRDSVFVIQEESVQRIPLQGSSVDFQNPRIHALGGRHLLGSRGDSRFTNLISEGLEYWTRFFGHAFIPPGQGSAVPMGERDSIFKDGRVWLVGNGFARSSNDGLWWADESEGLAGAVLSGIAADDDFLTAAGDDGKVFRRPVRSGPSFFRQPHSQTVARGYALRLTARASGVGDAHYQWHRNGHPLPGANGEVLTVDPVGVDDAGVYTLLATDDHGSTFSKEAVIEVSGAPMSNAQSWQVQGHAPHVHPSFHPSLNRVVTNGERLLAVRSQDLASLSDNGMDWVSVRLPVSGAYLFAWRGKFHVSAPHSPHSNQTWVSGDGMVWRSDSSLPDVTTMAVDGDGITVAGIGQSLQWTEDGETWHTGIGGLGGFIRFLVRGNGLWVAAGNADRTWVSTNGKEWDEVPIAPPGHGTLHAVTGLAFGNGVFVLTTQSGSFHTARRSVDGRNWSDVRTVSVVSDLRFEADYFWRSGVDGNVYLSPDGWSWADVSSGVSGPQTFLISVEENGLLLMSNKRLFRRVNGFAPLLFEPLPTDAIGFPGESLTLAAPPLFATEAVEFQWFAGDEPEGTERDLEIDGLTPENAVPRLVRVCNAFGCAEITRSIKYVDSYDAWADAFPFGGQPRTEEEDPDGRGIPNWLRYAFHLDPVSPDRAGLPRFSLKTINGNSYPQVEFQVSFGVDDVAWVWEHSADLAEWTEMAGNTEVEEEREGSLLRLTIRSADPLPPGGHFFRLRMSRVTFP